MIKEKDMQLTLLHLHLKKDKKIKKKDSPFVLVGNKWGAAKSKTEIIKEISKEKCSTMLV